jgi:hypothetical protein
VFKSAIVILKDEESVLQTKKEILQELQNSNEIRDSQLTLVQKYKAGDFSVSNALISLIKKPFNENKMLLYDELIGDYGEKFKFKDPVLRKIILNNLSIPEEEGYVIHLAGKFEFPEAADLFEQRLRSGKSEFDDQLIYYLSLDGTKDSVIELIEFKIRNNPNENDLLLNCFDALANYMQYGTPSAQKIAFNSSLSIYKDEVLSPTYFDELKEEYNYENPAGRLLEILFNYGDHQILPIAKIYKRHIGVSFEVMSYLVRIEGNKHKKEVLKYLQDLSTYMDGVKLVSILYQNNPDDRIFGSILRNFQDHYATDFADYTINTVLEELIKMDSIKTVAQIEQNLNNPELEEAFLSLLNLKQMSIEEKISKLKALNLIKTDTLDHGEIENNIYDILSSYKLTDWFYSEDDSYTITMERFLEMDQGILNGLLFSVNENNLLLDQRGEIVVQAVLNEVGYRLLISPETYGKAERMAYFLNQILAENDIEERFNSMGDDYDECYIFGAPKEVSEMEKIFRW